MKIEVTEYKTTEVSQASRHKTTSKAEWLVARKDLLMREKELTRLRDEISRHRRELPWVKVEKQYVFDAPGGKVRLAELFEDRSQLFVKRAGLRHGRPQANIPRTDAWHQAPS